MAIAIEDGTTETGGEWTSRLDGYVQRAATLPLRCEPSTRRPSTGS